ncbi:MAG: diguanylate cyclase [Planctomycetota bacterium]
MFEILIDVAFGTLAAGAGVAIGWLWCAASAQRHLERLARMRARATEEAIERIVDIATEMAADVDRYRERVSGILNELSTPRHIESRAIVSAVARLVEANQELKERLQEQKRKLEEQTSLLRLQDRWLREDPLTRILNRWGFEEELERKEAELRRHGHPVSICIWDLDHFKKLNDEHGHFAGDEALKHVAAILKRCMRVEDVIARLGGEEFAVILPMTTAAGAVEAAERAREVLAQTPFRYLGTELSVTTSVGVAELLTREQANRTLLRADDALYAAKTHGRNCTFYHDGVSVCPADPLTAEVARQESTATAESASLSAEHIGDTTGADDDATLARTTEEADVAGSAPAATESRVGPLEPDTTPAALDKAVAIERPECDAPQQDARPAGDRAALLDRVSFCQLVRSRLAEWQRGGAGVSIALFAVARRDRKADGMADDDHEMVVQVGENLRTVIREMDVLARYGPGCVAAIFPGAPPRAVVQLAARLIDELSQGSAGPASVALVQGLVYGLADAQRGDDLVRLLKRADESLRAALAAEGSSRGFYHNGRWPEPAESIESCPSPA